MNEQMQVLSFLFNACEQKSQEIHRLQGQIAELQAALNALTTTVEVK